MHLSERSIFWLGTYVGKSLFTTYFDYLCCFLALFYWFLSDIWLTSVMVTHWVCPYIGQFWHMKVWNFNNYLLVFFMQVCSFFYVKILFSVKFTWIEWNLRKIPILFFIQHQKLPYIASLTWKKKKFFFQSWTWWNFFFLYLFL